MHRTQRSKAGSSLIALATVLLGAAPALAQLEPAPVATTEPGIVMGGSELTSILQPAGQLVITVPLVISLTEDYVADPINVPLSVYYGLSDDFSLGISHSSGLVQGVMPEQIFNGLGLCLSGDLFCDKAYNNIGFDALFRFVPGTLQLAGHGGIDFRSLDPSYFALRVGVLAKAPLGANIAIVADPRIGLALNKTDEGNDHYLSFPVAVQFGTTSGMRISGMTGIQGPFDGFSDTFFGWLGVHLAVPVNQMIDVFGSFTFNNLYGNNGGADWRTLVVGTTIRL